MGVVCLGELLIDFVALESGVTVGDASGFVKAPGGAPANVAVAVARLGTQSAFLGQVGNDPFGRFLADVLAAETVNVDGLRFTDEARTMLAFVSNTHDGERSFMFYRHPSADMLMTPDDIATDVIDAARVFHFGSITLISEPAKSATLAAAEHAQQAGKIISYDPNLRLALWPDAEAAREGMRLGLKYATIAKISLDELDTLLYEGEQLSDFWSKFDNLKIMVITDGKNGSKLHTRDGRIIEAAGNSVKSIEATGAGDAFVAGMLVSILEGLDANGTDDLMSLDFDAIQRFANATGALATLQKGAIPSLPTRQQAEDFLAQ